MVLVKILKRKDASSVLVAILLAMIITQPLNAMTIRLASKISTVSNGVGGYGGPGGPWKNEYLFPLVWAILQIIILEILAWIYVLGKQPMRKNRG
jgi:hypothetical protein